MDLITEECARIIASEGKITKKLDVFYNPLMKLNRDISILLLNSITDRNMQIGLPLSGSGIRGIRFLKELKKDKIKRIYFNDIDKKSVNSIIKNIVINKCKKKFKIENKDANIFLLQSKGFDYIDIDPFGSPNPFLENSIVRLARDGILAVTATDTAALSGSSPKACMRKYWAIPLRNEFMHEIAVRILIRKIQLIGAQNEKALDPVFSYYSDHYYRIFFRCKKGKKNADEIIKKHGSLVIDNKLIGPLWLGNLWDKKLAEKMYKNCDTENKKIYSLLSIIKEESKIDTIGSYDIHKISKKTKKNPKLDEVISKIKSKGFLASRTHFNLHAIKSDINSQLLIQLVKE